MLPYNYLRKIFEWWKKHSLNIVLFFSISLLTGKGWGYSELFMIAIGLTLGLYLYENVKLKETFGIICISSAVLTALLFPYIVHLYGFWALVTRKINKNSNFPALSPFFLILWLIQLTAWGSYTLCPYIALILALIFFLFSKHINQIIYNLLIAVCILISCIDLYGIYRVHDIQIGTNNKFADGYKQGAVLAKLLQGTLVYSEDVLGDVGIVSLADIDKKHNKAKKQIILVEHCIEPTEEYPIPKGGELMQKKPWTFNQLYGDQYLLTAIFQDGQWVSNLGGNLKYEGRILLASSSHKNGNWFEPIIVKTNNQYYVQDSDPFVDRLSCYQKNALKEMVRGKAVYRILNIILLIGLFNPRYFLPISLIFTVFICSYIDFKPVIGDVRIFADITDPHEPSKSFGVLRSLADSGFPLIQGNKNCHILIIGKRKKITANITEKLIIAEEGSKVTVGDKVFSIGEIPQGDINGITDGRLIFLESQSLGVSYKLNDITIIGTGSPSKQNWKQLINKP